MLAIRDAATVSTSGRPSAGPLRSRTRMAWLTSRWLTGSESYRSSGKSSTCVVIMTSHSTRDPLPDSMHVKNILNPSADAEST